MRDSQVAQRPPANAGDTGGRDVSLIPGSGRSPGEENGNPLQSSCLENSMNGGAWWASLRSWTRLSTHTHTHTHTLSLSLSLSLFEWENQRKVVKVSWRGWGTKLRNDLVTQLFRNSEGPRWKEYYRTSPRTLQSTHSEIEGRGS